MTAHMQKLEFKSELKQILNLITHSLYSHKEVFLRELISNASDAIDKMRFDSLANEAVLGNNREWKIKITADKNAGTLTVSDNGVGMTRETVIDNLGTIAKSGTKEFLEQLKNTEASVRPELIGQFGVGFYSAFMVADTVTVVTRSADTEAEAVRWVSDGQGEYSIEPAEKPMRGTDVILHLKEDEREFLEEWKIRSLVKEFSDFIEHPIVMDVEKEADGKKSVEEETLNSRKALWLRSKSDVTKEEYNHFYKQITNDFNDPARVLHYTGEGTIEFKVLLFLPSKKPFDMMFGEVKSGPKLYIRRVLVMDHCEQLLPSYLRFVKGVVDCSDLPLNVSREMLQQNPMLEKIKNNLVKSILKNLEEMKTSAYDEYVGFFKEFGMFLKEGLTQDYLNRDQISKLLLFGSMKTDEDKFISLTQYAETMPADQKDIYYLTGESRETLAHAPYLEVFRSKEWDVLFMTEPIDEFILPSLFEFDGKRLVAADKSDVSIPAAEENKDAGKEFAAVFGALKGKLAGVKDVRVSTRLKESASCLVSDKDAMSANMERIMQKLGPMGGEPLKQERILELNTEHPAVRALKSVFEADPADPRIDTYAQLLYDQAVIAEGSKIKDPAAFARLINDLLVRNAGA